MRNFDHPLGCSPSGAPRRQASRACRPPPRGAEALARRIDRPAADRAVAHWYRAHGAAQAGQMDEATRHFRACAATRSAPRAPRCGRRASLHRGPERAPLVDLAADLGPLPDGRLFDDNLHPSPLGARQMADRFVPVVRAELARQPGP